MRLGKLDNDDLERLILSKFPRTRPESFLSPAIGLDCAALDLGGDLAVLSCDPITSAGVSHLGRLSVDVCCNDAAAAGAEPVGLLVTLLAPPYATEADLSRIADDLSAAAHRAHVDIIGGHTEVTDAVTRFVTNTSVIARMPKAARLPGMRPGNDIVMTKSAGLEGASILLSDYADRLAGIQLPADALESVSGSLSIVPESRVALHCGATAMHDVTEGGVLGALWELCNLHGCGARIDSASIPVLPITRAVCDRLGLDPLRLIGSGSLLIACADGDALCRALASANIAATLLGKADSSEILTDANEAAIPPPGADEIYRLS